MSQTTSINPNTTAGSGAPKPTKLWIFWTGKQMCPELAQKLQQEAPEHGYLPVVNELDCAVEIHTLEEPVAIIASTYDGKAWFNGRNFFNDLTSDKSPKFEGVKYSVFGCGLNVFKETYQRVPRTIDEELSARGGFQLYERGIGEASTTVYDRFDRWKSSFFKTLPQYWPPTPNLPSRNTFKVELHDITERHEILRQKKGLFAARVLENKILTSPSHTEVARQIDFIIMSIEPIKYSPGDTVAILPSNDSEDVRLALELLGISAAQEVDITADFAWMPTGRPILLSDLLSKYVDLRYPVTHNDIDFLKSKAYEESTRDALEALVETDNTYDQQVVDARLSLLDLLSKYSDINISLEDFLRRLQPMRARQYSISSSPLDNPNMFSLTFREHNRGVCSGFLGRLKKWDGLYMSHIKAPHSFNLPTDIEKPLIAIATGTGIAPIRSMLQHRYCLKKTNGNTVGKAYLFFGCHTPNTNYLYSDTDLEEWKKAGLLEVFPAFSGLEPKKYVQHVLYEQRSKVIEAYREDAKIFLCSHRLAANGVLDTSERIIMEILGCDKATAYQQLQSVNVSRYLTDVF